MINMRLSKFGFNLCANYARHRPFQAPSREMTLPPRDSEGDLPELGGISSKKKAKRPAPPGYASPKIQQKQETPNPDKVVPKDSTKKFVPMPDLACYMTYNELLKSIKPILQKYFAMMLKYSQFQLLWKKFRHP
ncbi:uncharacterized protein LOC134676492 [Cydia fagiglandana]|uniref:uncharacterized protein LOC134676492 n=1 Tax=Cydia fagiglandana TaxID=1458189 RepID=UPI002FEE4269